MRLVPPGQERAPCFLVCSCYPGWHLSLMSANFHIPSPSAKSRVLGVGQSSGCDSTGLGFYMEMPLRDSPALQTLVEISLFYFDLSFSCLFYSSAIVILSSGGPATMDQPLCSRRSRMYGILRRLHMQQCCDGCSVPEGWFRPGPPKATYMTAIQITLDPGAFLCHKP